jgi:hypothetical protein
MRFSITNPYLFFLNPYLSFLNKSIQMDLGIFLVDDAEVVPFGLSIVIGPIRLTSAPIDSMENSAVYDGDLLEIGCVWTVHHPVALLWRIQPSARRNPARKQRGARMDAGRNVPIGTLMLPFGAFP